MRALDLDLHACLRSDNDTLFSIAKKKQKREGIVLSVTFVPLLMLHAQGPAWRHMVNTRMPTYSFAIPRSVDVSRFGPLELFSDLV